MKIFQFQNGGNTRFLYQETPREPTLQQATEDLKLETHAMLDTLKELVLQNPESAIQQGWEKTTDRKRKQKWKNKKNKEIFVLENKDGDEDFELGRYKDRDGKEKVKYYTQKKENSSEDERAKVIKGTFPIENEQGEEVQVMNKVTFENTPENKADKVVVKEENKGGTVAKIDNEQDEIKIKGPHTLEEATNVVEEHADVFTKKKEEIIANSPETNTLTEISNILKEFPEGFSFNDLSHLVKNEAGEQKFSAEKAKQANEYARKIQVICNKLQAAGEIDFKGDGENDQLDEDEHYFYKDNNNKEWTNTRKAVQALQEWAGIDEKSADGLFGESTLQKLNAKMEKKLTAPVVNDTPTKVFTVKPGEEGFMAPKDTNSQSSDEPLFQINEDKVSNKDFARTINKLMRGEKVNFDEKEKVTPITVDKMVSLLDEGNQENASDETIEKITNLALDARYFESWTEENWLDFAEKIGIEREGIPFDIMDSLQGNETLPELQKKKENIEKFSNEIQKMKTRYQNLFDKSALLKEMHNKLLSNHQSFIQEIDEAIDNPEKTKSRRNINDQLGLIRKKGSSRITKEDFIGYCTSDVKFVKKDGTELSFEDVDFSTVIRMGITKLESRTENGKTEFAASKVYLDIREKEPTKEEIKIAFERYQKDINEYLRVIKTGREESKAFYKERLMDGLVKNPTVTEASTQRPVELSTLDFSTIESITVKRISIDGSSTDIDYSRPVYKGLSLEVETK